MSFLKQTVLTIVLLVLVTGGWVYFSPQAIGTLANYNMAFEPLKAIAALNPTTKDGEPTQTPGRGGRGGSRQALVITSPVTSGIINDRLTAIGSGRAAQYVTITPLVSGQLVDLPASSGDRIESGAVIARLDAADEELGLDRTRLVADDLRVKAERFQDLLAQRTVSAVEVETAQASLATAELAVREAQLALDRRTVRSPIGGIVGIVAANIGDYVTNQSPIVTVDDRSRITVEYFVPERFVTAIETGAPVQATSVARPGEVFSGTVLAVDNRIDVASRTLRVRAEIANDNDRLRAGMAFEVTMRFDGESFPAVDPLAIQWDANGSYVWQVGEDGKARRRDARIVQRNAHSVLVDADLSQTDTVVTEGVQNVREGVDVTIAGGTATQPTTNDRRRSGS